jgi:hypothetical protein
MLLVHLHARAKCIFKQPKHAYWNDILKANNAHTQLSVEANRGKEQALKAQATEELVQNKQLELMAADTKVANPAQFWNCALGLQLQELLMRKRFLQSRLCSSESSQHRLTPSKSIFIQ